MKYITLIRHAKSSWKNLNLSDHDRPLNKRGKRTAPIMGQRLLKKGIFPQLFISSTAKRALKTAEIIAVEIGFSSANITTYASLFHATEYQICKVISESNNEADALMLVAHNPGITYLANQLLNNLLNPDTFDNIPTAGVVTFAVDMQNWQDILDAEISTKTKLVDYDYPKKQMSTF